MSQEQALQFLQQGIAAAKAKQNEQARKLLQNTIRLNPANETAWLWLSSVAKDQNERIFCLRQLLQINPNNDMALKGLQALGVEAASAATPAAPVPPPQPKDTAVLRSEQAATPSAPPQPQAPAAPGGIPLPPREKLAAALEELDAIIQRTQPPPDDLIPDIEWRHKRGRRAGERAATLLRLAVIVVPLLAVLLVGGLIAAFLFGSPQGQAMLQRATQTPFPTATSTFTPTPGATPTPSLTPEVPPTLTPPFPAAAPRGSINRDPTATPIFPDPSDQQIEQAIALMDEGNYSDALPLLTNLRSGAFVFDAQVYYYEAIALSELDRAGEAEQILQEGLARQDSNDDPLLHAGLAYVYASQGEYSSANDEAEAAIARQPRLSMAYQIIARSGIASGDYAPAAQALDRGIAALPGDVNLWLLRGELNLVRGQPGEAQYDAAGALYVDATNEAAYHLRARADLATGDYGLAVLHLQEYLFYYQGSITGWTLLGDARAREGNTDAALLAYSQAVNTTERLPEQFAAFLGRAGLYMQMRRYAEAYEDYSAAVALNSEGFEARAGRAETAYLTGRYDEVIEETNVILAAQPDRTDLQLLKARALVEDTRTLGDEAQALEQSTQRELTASEQTALAEAQAILGGRFDENFSGSERAEVYEYRARILLAQGNYAEAQRSITSALELQQTGTRRFISGMLAQLQGDDTGARRAYRWVQQWNPYYGYAFMGDVTRLMAMLETG